ncbi:1269_t:CDS:2 [Funneliformis geosporum]|uniref:1269_t:CDS:1 n=1 Tax=Funneliformis geosporum TaxID=1117311 RepID=A0A9W4WS09_9GLOM|nr:1269_t:CDS:2 [Funneliformis geosporum]
MVNNNGIPFEVKKPFETVYEIKNKTPSFEEFMKTYQEDKRANESYKNEIAGYGNVGVFRGYGSCSRYDACKAASEIVREVEEVHEVENYIPTYEEFLKNYQVDQAVNNSYENEIESYSDVGVNKGFGPCYVCNKPIDWTSLYIPCPVAGCSSTNFTTQTHSNGCGGNLEVSTRGYIRFMAEGEMDELIIGLLERLWVWLSQWTMLINQEYCCSCAYQIEQERAREYSSYQLVYQRKKQEKKDSIQQLQLLKDYPGCRSCSSKEIDAYNLYENNQLVCQPCLIRKEGRSSSPISLTEQQKWYKKHWKIDLGE